MTQLHIGKSPTGRRAVVAGAIGLAGAGGLAWMWRTPSGPPPPREVHEVVGARLDHIRERFLERDLTPMPPDIAAILDGGAFNRLMPLARSAKVTSIAAGSFSKVSETGWRGPVRIAITFASPFLPAPLSYEVECDVVMAARRGGWVFLATGQVTVRPAQAASSPV